MADKARRNRDFKLVKHMEISENKEILRKNIKELAFTYRRLQNSHNILKRTNNRIKSIDNEIQLKKSEKKESLDVETLMMIDSLEFLFESFLGPTVGNNLKEKLEDFDRRAEDYRKCRIDANFFLAKMFSFEEKFLDFNARANALITKYRDLTIRQTTLMNRFQDLQLQV